MNIYCIKFLMFTKSRNIKTKRETDGKINIYSRFIYCGFKNLKLLKKQT